MLEEALQVLKKITNEGFKAYIVGGFVRDFILNKKTNDIDICTNATPKDVIEIFKEGCLPNEEYGSVILRNKKIKYEITTFRKEIGYIENRKPAKIKYIDDLYQDLLRRDFTVNTLCINEEGEILDFLGGKDDIDKKIIRSVLKAKDKFEEDCLRILRAVRFATVLDFSLDDEIIVAIKEKKYLLKNLSYDRKKEELDKIFSSPNAMKGIKLLLELGLDKDLEIENLKNVKVASNFIGVWSILNVVDIYPFSSNEKKLINDINKVLALDNFDIMTLYKYGLYVNSVAAELKMLDIKKLTESYNNLVIKDRKDIDISSEEIMNILNKNPGSYLKDVYDELENKILYGKLNNQRKEIINYIKNKYVVGG